jgi:hypothetical protein
MIEEKRKLQGSERFDPFTNRTARDIRNSLSDAFVAALAAKEPEQYLNIAQKWQEQNLSARHREYIANRLLRYDHVFDEIQADRIEDPLQRALVIWNQRLFFEVHEHLEAIWHSASGDERQALRGLIKAAGVYVHLEQRRLPAARSLAVKSYELLRQYPHCLAFIANYEILLKKLKNFESDPPRLEISSIHD